MEFVWVGLGGLVGANARYGMTKLMVARFGDSLPWGTFAINMLGSLLIGILLTTLSERVVADPAIRPVLVVGFLGAFTTFSSYTFEAIALAETGRWTHAAAYVIGSNGLGLLLCAAGMYLARHVAT
jgi:CrcB protein